MNDPTYLNPCSNNSSSALLHDCKFQKFRFRTILRRPTAANANCPVTEDSRRCNTESCDQAALNRPEVVDCEVTSWAPWSACSKTCGSGIMHRFRVIVRKPRNGGRSCGNLEENKPCDAGFCYG